MNRTLLACLLALCSSTSAQVEVVYPFISTVLHEDIYKMFQEEYLQGSYTLLNAKERRLLHDKREAMKKITFSKILFTPIERHHLKQ